MLGLAIITKRELAVYTGTIADLRKEIERLTKQIEHERLRAEGAINLLLARTQKAVLTPELPQQVAQEEVIKKAMLNIFGDEEEGEEKQSNEEKLLEQLQS